MVEEVPPPHRHGYNQRPRGCLPQQASASDEKSAPERVVLEIVDLLEGTEDSPEDRSNHLGIVEQRVRYLLDEQFRAARLPYTERTVDEHDHPYLPVGRLLASTTSP